MPFGNSSINLSKQSEFIRRHGEWLTYYVSMKCTCSLLPTGALMPDANRADPNCLACKGLGLLWQAQGQILGLIQNISQHKDLLQSGVAAPGDLVLSPDLKYTVSDYDKIEMVWTDGIPYEGQLITRTTGSVIDKTDYPILSATNCIQVDKVTGVVTTYVPNVDFTFSGNQITWIANKPADGTYYSFKYGALLDWICFAPPQPRLERGTNLGQRIVMRKKHLVVFGR